MFILLHHNLLSTSTPPGGTILFSKMREVLREQKSNTGYIKDLFTFIATE